MLFYPSWPVLLLLLLALTYVVAAAVTLRIQVRRGLSSKTMKLLLVVTCLLTFGIYVGLFDTHTYGVAFLVPMILAYLVSIALPISFAIIGVSLTAARGARPRLQAGAGFAAGALGIVIGQLAIVMGEITGLLISCMQAGDCM
jgi:hypothetical protein